MWFGVTALRYFPCGGSSLARTNDCFWREADIRQDIPVGSSTVEVRVQLVG
jgi:hypothetical protein